MSNETMLTRRGLFMKMGVLFNGVVAAALAVPIVQFLLSSVTRGRANGYLSWVPLGPFSDFPKVRRGWPRSGIRTSRRPMARRRTPPAGCAASKANNSRCLRSIARTWAVRSAGSHNPGCSCVRATAALTIATARALRDRRSAGSSNIRKSSERDDHNSGR